MEWEIFARDLWHGDEASPAALRDHAKEMLIAVARDMSSEQTASEQKEKSEGDADSGDRSRIDAASVSHGGERVGSGFALQDVIAEFRALRASVIRLWQQSMPESGEHLVDDLVRFNEAIDQLLATSVREYVRSVEYSRNIFLGILGHDLRTPLHAVTMLADLMLDSDELSEDSAELVAQIATSGHAMVRMLKDLLDFTATQSGGKVVVTPASMDMESLGREVIDEMRAVHPSRRFDLEQRGELKGEWDRDRLRQLISNLLGNAVQHGAATSPIELVLNGTASKVELSVRNQGAPIPREELQSIFEPMRRKQEAETTRPAGSVGLGLYIAREIVTAHGGTINVKSDEEGTAFVVALPRALSE